jgi:transcriptional antiterminator RfaH
MPLLPLEPFVYPEGLLALSPKPDDNSSRWWVLHTRPRAEKMLSRKLLKQEVSFFLPLYQRQWRSRGRLLSSYLPLFSGYVFIKSDSSCAFHTFETNLVAQVLPVVDQEQLHSDLVRVHRLIIAGSPLTSEARLQPGSPIEIVRGPFSGLKGTVIRRGKQLKFVVEVQFLQQGASVELESWMIEPQNWQGETEKRSDKNLKRDRHPSSCMLRS